MENTCVGEKCWFYLLIKDLTGNKEKSLDFKDCPFYMEMIWTPVSVGGKNESAKIIKDCSNKRSLLVLLEDVHPRLTGVEKSHEEMRNRYVETKNVFDEILYLTSKSRNGNPPLKTIAPVTIEGEVIDEDGQ
jgi:hypothetical protein